MTDSVQRFKYDPTTVNVPSAPVSNYQEFRAVDPLLGGDDWINYGRRNRMNVGPSYGLTSDGTYISDGTQMSSGQVT